MGDEARMETGTKKWDCGVIRPPEQFSGYSMEERGTSGKIKTLSSRNSTYWVVLVGAWESQMLRNVDCSHVLEGFKYQWVWAFMWYLATNLTSFWPCPGTLSVADFKDYWLICLAKETSHQEDGPAGAEEVPVTGERAAPLWQRENDASSFKGWKP